MKNFITPPNHVRFKNFNLYDGIYLFVIDIGIDGYILYN